MNLFLHKQDIIHPYYGNKEDMERQGNLHECKEVTGFFNVRKAQNPRWKKKLTSLWRIWYYTFQHNTPIQHKSYVLAQHTKVADVRAETTIQLSDQISEGEKSMNYEQIGIDNELRTTN